MKTSISRFAKTAFFLAFFGPATLRAQEILTLEKALELAHAHNVQLRQAQYAAAISNATYNQAKFDYLPRLNAFADANRTFGTTIDNITFQRVQRTTTTSYPSINASLVLFDGFSKYFTAKQAAQLAQADQQGVALAERDMENRVTGYYLQALFEQENLHITQDRIELLSGQLGRMEKLEKAGLKTEEDVLLLRSQLATEKVNLLTQQSNLSQYMLYLVQELNTDSRTQYVLAKADVPATLPEPAGGSAEAVYTQSALRHPSLLAASLRVRAARSGLHLARSNFSPTLALAGTSGSYYSSNGIFDPDTRTIVDAPYLDQIDRNRYSVVSLRLSVPLFSGFSQHYENQKARLSLRNAELEYRTAENRLRQNIEQAYREVVLAKEKHGQAQAAVEASEKSFSFMKRRFEAGTADFFVYLETLNNKNRAETSLLQSRYEYYFKTRILALYQR